MTGSNKNARSAAAEALAAAGDQAQADDIAALEAASQGAERKLATTRKSLVERVIYGPPPNISELFAGADRMLESSHSVSDSVLDTSMAMLASGQAFTTDGKLSQELRDAVADDGAYGFTVPAKYSGKGLGYSQLARLEESLASNGLGALAVEISGQLTIGSSALLGYGTEQQKSTFLPLIADGELIAFALTEVGVGVNAKRIQAWVDRDEAAGCWRLHAQGACNKLYITSATHGGLAAVVARKGEESNEIGLFIVRLPDTDVDDEFGFECVSSNVSAFAQNINSRISFRNFPIPFEQEIQGDGVEVLFYCLRMGRCMLAAMCAGFQRMLAADAASYAQQREGVGGRVIGHELPRLGIARMLGGALTAQSLAHLALSQDADGADLAGLRDVTKSASARYALESLVACERVIGGRSLDNDSRITEARPVIHAFGIVEGEDDLIRMGMVKDLTGTFTARHMQGVLGILRAANTDKDGNARPEDERIYRVGISSLIRFPTRTCRAIAALATSTSTWRLAGWIVRNGTYDLLRSPLRLLPTRLLPRYRELPARLAAHLRFAERELRRCRWTYALLNLYYQLELTRAQIPMQRFGKRIELLVALTAICAHAARLDRSTQQVAEFQAVVIRNELKATKCIRDLPEVEKLRSALAAIAQDVESGSCSLIQDVAPQAHAHPWSKPTENPAKV